MAFAAARRALPCWAPSISSRHALWERLVLAAPAIGGHRGLAAAVAADAPPGDAAPAAWQRRFEGVSPGSTLRIDLQQAPADLVIAVGEHEAIELHASEASLLAEQQPHDHPGSSLVAVSLGAAAAPAAAPLQLRARGPSRFLTVEATTGGGSVSVEVVQEGSLRLSTGGGSISVPKVKAVEAHLDSGGGPLSGAVTGVDVRLRSGGGGVRLKSLVGRRVLVDSGGGAVTLGACYADHLELSSGGGPVHVTNMDCREGHAALSSAGGAVAVDSLDGNCSIASQGGDVQVQLHDNAGSISVQSGGGGIQLFLSPGVPGRLRLKNCARVAARPGALQLARPQDDGSLELQLPLGLGPARGSALVAGLGLGSAGAAAAVGQAPRSRLERGGPTGAPPPPGNAVTSASRGHAGGAEVVLDAGGGGVSLSERSWLQAMQAMQQKAQAPS